MLLSDFCHVSFFLQNDNNEIIGVVSRQKLRLKFKECKVSNLMINSTIVLMIVTCLCHQKPGTILTSHRQRGRVGRNDFFIMTCLTCAFMK